MPFVDSFAAQTAAKFTVAINAPTMQLHHQNKTKKSHPTFYSVRAY